MTQKKHKEIHEKFHRNLDEMMAEFIMQTGKLPSKTSLMEFVEWSYAQMQNPIDNKTLRHENKS